MRVVYFGNNWVGWQIVGWLREQGEDICGLVLHPSHKGKYVEEIALAAHVSPACTFDGSRLGQPETVEAIKNLRPDIGVSAFFGYILRQPLLDLLPAGCINIHPGILPYNRGTYPNVWSIVDGTPAGVTVHYMNAGVDTGDIIARNEIVVEPVDTGQSLYRKLELACVNLFKDAWPLIRSGRVPRIRQAEETGTSHQLKDVDCIDEIDLDRTYTARYLIDVIRARTFPPYAGAYFVHHGRKIYLRLQLFFQEPAE